jgi:hypothetical protein
MRVSTGSSPLRHAVIHARDGHLNRTEESIWLRSLLGRKLRWLERHFGPATLALAGALHSCESPKINRSFLEHTVRHKPGHCLYHLALILAPDSLRSCAWNRVLPVAQKSQ